MAFRLPGLKTRTEILKYLFVIIFITMKDDAWEDDPLFLKALEKLVGKGPVTLESISTNGLRTHEESKLISYLRDKETKKSIEVIKLEGSDMDQYILKSEEKVLDRFPALYS